jgi:endoglucanase
MRVRSAPRRTITHVFVVVLALGVLGALAASTPTSAAPAPAAQRAPKPVVVAVSGNQLVNAAGQSIRLLGVDRSGTEYACEEGWGIFDGPSDAKSVVAMAKWHVNAVRLPLNEGCWLDEFTAANDSYAGGDDPSAYEGAAYQSAIGAYVALLHKHKMAVILTLTGLDVPGGLEVPPMADAAFSPTFWSSVATFFKVDPGVLFDLYNEPNGIDWSCWLNGCTVPSADGTYEAAGMQSLVTAVRDTGATQPIMLGGLDYSSDETSWSANLPVDPDNSLVVSFHTYDSTNCNTETCWNDTLGPLTLDVPVVAGEFGEYDCATSYSDSFMTFADTAGISYLGWAWDAISPGGWSCSGPALITNYNGTPSGEGVALRSHLSLLKKHRQLPLPV